MNFTCAVTKQCQESKGVGQTFYQMATIPMDKVLEIFTTPAWPLSAHDMKFSVVPLLLGIYVH